MGEELFVREQVALRVLHADRRVHGSAETEVRHVAYDQVGRVALVGDPLREERDVLLREIEAGHLVAAIGQADQVGPGPARDVEDPAHAASGEVAEGVDEEVHLPFAIHVERDLVQPRGRVLSQRMSPHQVSMASRITQDAAMPVRPLGSQA